MLCTPTDALAVEGRLCPGGRCSLLTTPGQGLCTLPGGLSHLLWAWLSWRGGYAPSILTSIGLTGQCWGLLVPFEAPGKPLGLSPTCPMPVWPEAGTVLAGHWSLSEVGCARRTRDSTCRFV